ncbi:MAG: hypothetical protein GH144_06560 [Clostridia bacterium]|nr:hypothetical protein [Clostridia bacterium]
MFTTKKHLTNIMEDIMQKDLLEAINHYKARTPEFEEIMRKFHISQDEYERTLTTFAF